MSFDVKLLQGVLVCPKCKSLLIQDGDSLVSVDPQCRFRYAIHDGIPDMLVENAQTLSPEDWSRIMQAHGRDAGTGAPAAV